MKLFRTRFVSGVRDQGRRRVRSKSPASAAWSRPPLPEVTFLANPKYAHKLRHTRAGAVLLARAHRACGILAVGAAHFLQSFISISPARRPLFYQPPRPQPGIHPLAWVATSASSARTPPSDPLRWWGKMFPSGITPCCIRRRYLRRSVHWRRFLCPLARVVREHCRVGNRVILQNGAIRGRRRLWFRQARRRHTCQNRSERRDGD